MWFSQKWSDKHYYTKKKHELKAEDPLTFSLHNLATGLSSTFTNGSSLEGDDKNSFQQILPRIFFFATQPFQSTKFYLAPS